MGHKDQYSKYFPVGMRVGVGIPMQNGELFRDWAYILEIEEDLTLLQLSRDVLPEDVDLKTGKVVELRCGKEGKGFRCSGVFVSVGQEGTIQIRLSGDVNTNELREFYRIETYLPFRAEAAKEHNLDLILREWRARKQQYQDEQANRKQDLANKRRERFIRSAEGEYVAVDGKIMGQDAEDHELIDESWDEVMAYAVNLSGGGFKFVTAEPYKLDDIMFLEVFIPSNPPRIMQCVARVVFKNRNYYVGSDAEYHNVAFSFLFIDERDRDAIVSLISSLELLRIRMQRRGALVQDRSAGKKGSSILIKIGGALILITCLTMLFLYFKNYMETRPKGEIEETFEGGIRKYLEKFK